MGRRLRQVATLESDGARGERSWLMRAAVERILPAVDATAVRPATPAARQVSSATASASGALFRSWLPIAPKASAALPVLRTCVAFDEPAQTVPSREEKRR